MPAGRRLLGLVQRMKQSGMAMAQCINRIARQRLEGQPLSLLAPPGFDATLTNALVFQAVAWTAVLRARLLALVAVRPSFVAATATPAAERAPQGRGAAFFLPKAVPNPTEDDLRHDWWGLAAPLRIGPAGVAAAAHLIGALSNQEVTQGVCDKLSTAAVNLGAAADVPSFNAIAADARALCAELDAAAAKQAAGDAAADAAADPAAAAAPAPVLPAAEAPPTAQETGAEPPSAAPGTEAEHDPPLKPPDG